MSRPKQRQKQPGSKSSVAQGQVGHANPVELSHSHTMTRPAPAVQFFTGSRPVQRNRTTSKFSDWFQPMELELSTYSSN
ncbi:hypothetical protein FF2_009512 [Malus domestica]